MERIFSGEVYDIVPQPGGIIFSYCRGASENKVAVFYKMYSLESNTIDDVTNSVYLISKFGSNYHAAASLCRNYVTAKSVIFPNGRVFVCSDTGEASLLDGNNSVIWKGEFKYRNNAPSGIAVYKNSLWSCFANNGVLIRFGLSTMREELRIGGTAHSPFDRPYDIFIEGDTAIVSNVGSHKLIRVDLENYTVEEIHEFSESVYSYVKIKENEFVLLESGIYKL